MSIQYSQVVLLAGPSGSGKSYIARRTGLPVLCLDDFYKDGHDPTLPTAHGHIDWDSPASWDGRGAVQAIARLSATGRANVPVYDIARSRRVDDRVFSVGQSPLFIAEGIFAAEIVRECKDLGLLADAVAVRRPRNVTFVRRLIRDLREHRKSPTVLWHRGLLLWRKDPEILRRQVELGCVPLPPREIIDTLRIPALSSRR